MRERGKRARRSRGAPQAERDGEFLLRVLTKGNNCFPFDPFFLSLSLSLLCSLSQLLSILGAPPPHQPPSLHHRPHVRSLASGLLCASGASDKQGQCVEHVGQGRKQTRHREPAEWNHPADVTEYIYLPQSTFRPAFVLCGGGRIKGSIHKGRGGGWRGRGFSWENRPCLHSYHLSRKYGAFYWE